MRERTVHAIPPTAFYLLVVIMLAVFPAVNATTINVPADQPTIQAAINTAIDNDTVLVAPGTYYENIRYFGKNILVTSHFIFDKDPQFIKSTIIDGSQPSHPDTASVVRIVDSETKKAILQGFTITGGRGTTWPDPHGFGDFREGGGILTEFSSPIIRYNLIINNSASYVGTGMVSAGGGAIRTGDGGPQILNNVIMYNTGRYGPGIVINYASTTVKNNIIAYNTGGQDFGGGGIWKYNGDPSTIENNTIVYNTSTVSGGSGGGIYVSGSNSPMRNNLIWGNTPNQITGASTVSYSLVQGGRTGTGNIDLDPQLNGDLFYYLDDAPVVDMGDPSLLFYDNEDPLAGGDARWPAMGTTRNDIGAYGGPAAYPHQWSAIMADVRKGWVPLDVNMSAFSYFPATSFDWDFGDTQNGNGQTVAHTFSSAGIFNINLTTNYSGGSHLETFEQFIIAVADTLSSDTLGAAPGETIELGIMLNNTIPVTKVTVPVDFNGTAKLNFDSVSTFGCRNEGISQASMVNYDPFNSRYAYELTSVDVDFPALDPGEGLIMKIYFTVNPSAGDGQTAVISHAGFGSYQPNVESELFSYPLPTEDGFIEISLPPCCIGMRGNVDLVGIIDISDLVYLIDYQFRNGPEPECFDAANIDGEGVIEVTDAVYFIDYQFRNGPPPPDCPM